MAHHSLVAGAAALALTISGVGAAWGQVGVGTRPPVSAVGTATGAQLGEDIEDIQMRTERELAQAEDDARFGLSGTQDGFGGSVSLTGLSTWGNSDAIDAGLAGRFTLGQGAINHSLGFAVEYGEADGDRDRNRVLGIYDVTYDLSPQIYAFGLARGQYDEFAARNEQDFFAGVGPGIRLINQPNLAWRVQAGPGVRYTKDIDSGDTETELAAIASSRAYFQATDAIFLTNDTDVLYSDVDTLVSNELAVNSRLAGPLSARVGLRTDYSTDPAPGQKSTDNRLTLGVVYSFQ